MYFCAKKLVEFLVSQPGFLICVCGVWGTTESWQPVGWDPTITSQISASQSAHMGHDRKFCCPSGCNYPAGCWREWPLLLWHSLNPDLMSGLISKCLSAMPTPRPSTVDSELPSLPRISTLKSISARRLSCLFPLESTLLFLAH